MSNRDKKSEAVVLGCGSIGTRHIRNLLELGVDVTAFDPDPAKRAAVAQGLGVQTFKELDSALDSASAFAVVAAPTSLHVELAQAVASRNVAMFVEKPLSHSWSGVPELLATIRSRRLVSLIGCNLRFHPTLRRCKELLGDGAVGTPISARLEFGYHLPDWHPTEDYRINYSARHDLGGGIVLDAIHELDYATWLLGGVQEVACVARHLSSLEIDTEDVAGILLDFGEVIAEVHLDYVQRSYSRTCQVIGSHGTMRWDFGTGDLRWYSAESGEWQTEHVPEGWSHNDMYLAEMRHFVSCVHHGETPELDAIGGAEVLQVALAALISSSDHRFVRPSEVAHATGCGIDGLGAGREGRLPPS